MMMGDFFREIQGLFDSKEIDGQLEIMAGLYDTSGNCLKKIADKELAIESKLTLLKETAERERELEAGLDYLIGMAS